MDFNKKLQLVARAKTPRDGESCIEMGFDRVEITLPFPGGQDEGELWKELAVSKKIRFMSHGPQEGDPKDLVRLEKEYLPNLRLALDESARLSSPLLTVHFWMDSRMLKPEVLARKVELLRLVVDYGASLGVRVNLENLSESWDDLEPVLDSIPGLGLTLDVGHAQLLSRRNRSSRIITNGFDRLRHLHLHDNHGGNSPADDLHLIPGRGTTPFIEIFGLLKERNYNGTATLELSPDQMEEGRAWVERTWKES